MSERRGQRRVRGPFEAVWSATSGHRTVRVVDFSVTGCFVEDTAPTAVGEHVTISLRLPGGPPINAGGRVVYVYPSQGFGVVFNYDEGVAGALHAAFLRLSSG